LHEPRTARGRRRTRSARLHERHGAARFAELGVLGDGIDKAAFGIAPLLEWAEREGAKPPVDPED